MSGLSVTTCARGVQMGTVRALMSATQIAAVGAIQFARSGRQARARTAAAEIDAATTLSFAHSTPAARSAPWSPAARATVATRTHRALRRSAPRSASTPAPARIAPGAWAAKTGGQSDMRKPTAAKVRFTTSRSLARIGIAAATNQ